ncbi:MAG: RnfABCDGE type electron transport complex subunit C [Candidatus Omnitrophica bacterium]|nr:RnfABCDGE type electron transport complex subunit C [Candidatus Omnitrophota bacterium]
MRGGLCLNDKKETTLITWTIHRPRPAQKVRIPLMQSQGVFSSPCVEIGTHVKAGQKIAIPKHPDAVALHASLSGEVTAVSAFSHPLHHISRAIEITSDGRDETLTGVGKERNGWEALAPEETLALFQDSGLVDLADGQSLHAKIRAAQSQRKIHTLVLNGCESEPYLTADHALMMSHPVEILKGAEILRHVLGAERVIIAVEDNKLEPAELLKSKIYFLKWKDFDVAIFPTRYPQEDEDLLVQAVMLSEAKHLRAGILRPFVPQNDGGTLVFSVAASFAVYEAVALQKPLYERVVTVGGECVMEPKNIYARLGTSFDDCFKSVRGLLRTPGAVIMGGPMRGISQESTDVPVIAETRAILALPKELTEKGEIEACIRCGRCVEVCPPAISPATISIAVEKNIFEFITKEDVNLCTLCGLCAYVCPAQRPMTELMLEAKHHVLTLNGRNS